MLPKNLPKGLDGGVERDLTIGAAALRSSGGAALSPPPTSFGAICFAGERDPLSRLFQVC
jgi:hypothetical protein